MDELDLVHSVRIQESNLLRPTGCLSVYDKATRNTTVKIKLPKDS